MKYLVMECHEGYAILMDEASVFVRAANLHYSVGQTVTDPVLMEEIPERPAIIRSTIVKIAAAAACAVLVSAGSLGYYLSNMKTQSVVVFDNGIKIQMELNSKGKVIRLTSDTEEGQEIINEIDVKNKDSVSAAHELVKVEIDRGYIADGDTVDVVVSADDPINKKEIEEKLSEMPLDVKVRDNEAPVPVPTEPVKEQITEAPPKEEIVPPPVHEDIPKPPEVPETPPEPPKHEEVPPVEENIEPPKPPESPVDEAPKPPHDEAPKLPEAEAPPEPPKAEEPPKPVDPPKQEIEEPPVKPADEPPAPPHDAPEPPKEEVKPPTPPEPAENGHLPAPLPPVHE